MILVLHLALTCLISPIKDNLTHQSWSVSRPNSDIPSSSQLSLRMNLLPLVLWFPVTPKKSWKRSFSRFTSTVEVVFLSCFPPFYSLSQGPILGFFLNFHCQCQGSFLLTFTILLIERCIFRNIALYKRNFQKNKRESWPGWIFCIFFRNLHFKFFITMNKSCRWLGWCNEMEGLNMKM